VSVRLRPLREDEYADFLERGRKEYGNDLHENGSLTREAAAAKAARDYAQLLPQGLATSGHTIFAIEELETGERVGRLWFAERELDGRRIAFLFDIAIDEPHRGRGLGRAAMLAFEAVATEDGHDLLELNVFGGNARARGLYRSLGFVETAVHMQKQLVTDR
jgi:ribosomal protein S18 acetylase RimI-like enzyme